MAIIQLLVSLIVLGLLYVRMVRRETPDQVSKGQAITPVGLGVLSVPLSFIVFLGVGYALVKMGKSFKDLPAVAGSVLRAFIMAGLPEEITKLLMMLLTIRIFRSKIRNVYEYILIGAGVGIGFTLLEEFFYGSDGFIAFLRLPTVGAHMIFGMIMAKHLGMAAHNRAIGKGGIAKEYILAVVIPILIHSLFDATNGTSLLLESSDEFQQMMGIILSVA